MKKVLYTLGHSTRSIEYFTDILQVYSIQMVVDIRTIPKSKHNPQYNQEALRSTLKKFHIHYHHLKKLGGLRHTTKSSINLGWENLSFRGFADYMQSEEFWDGIEELEKLAEKYICAILCAEAVPWRCHRSLVADALMFRGWTVYHIQSKKTAKEHALTSFLTVDNGMLLYPSIK